MHQSCDLSHSVAHKHTFEIPKSLYPNRSAALNDERMFVYLAIRGTTHPINIKKRKMPIHVEPQLQHSNIAAKRRLA